MNTWQTKKYFKNITLVIVIEFFYSTISTLFSNRNILAIYLIKFYLGSVKNKLFDDKFIKNIFKIILQKI